MIPATQDLQLNIVRYTAEQKTVWDSFVATSKNGTFLFMRVMILIIRMAG